MKLKDVPIGTKFRFVESTNRVVYFTRTDERRFVSSDPSAAIFFVHSFQDDQVLVLNETQTYVISKYRF